MDEFYTFVKMQRNIKSLLVLTRDVFVKWYHMGWMGDNITFGTGENGSYSEFWYWKKGTFDCCWVFSSFDIAQIKRTLVGIVGFDNALDVFWPLFGSLWGVVVKIFWGWIYSLTHFISSINLFIIKVLNVFIINDLSFREFKL